MHKADLTQQRGRPGQQPRASSLCATTSRSAVSMPAKGYQAVSANPSHDDEESSLRPLSFRHLRVQRTHTF